MPACWLNGVVTTNSTATISVFDHGLLYGDGVFEGIRFYNGRCFMLDAHLARLARSAQALHLAMPYDLDMLSAALRDTINASGLVDGYLRLVLTRGSGPLGVNPANCPRPTVFIIADQLQMLSPALRHKGVHATIVATRRVPNNCWDSRIKSLNYLNNVLTSMQARAAGADEGIMLNQQGNISEGATNNIFIVQGGVLLTPPASDGALEGITRGVILTLADAAGIATEERSLTPKDLYEADECFLTGTGIELVPVRQVDNQVLPERPFPVFERISNAFYQFVAEHTQR